MAGTANSGGRNARSRQAHIIAGTFRGDRHGAHETPEPPKGRPEPPKELSGDALEEWNRMVSRMEASGTLSKVDDAAIYRYAKLFAQTEAIEVLQIQAQATLDVLNDNVSDFKEMDAGDRVALLGHIVQQQKIISKCTDQLRSGAMALRQYLVEFGMTPASRGRVKLPPQKPRSKVASFRAAKAGG